MPLAQSIPIPRINFGKRKQRSLMCEVLTDDGQIVRREGDVLRGCVYFPDKNEAFLIDTDNQYWDPEDKQWYQILGERSTVPLCLRRPNKLPDLQTLMEDIEDAAWRMDVNQQFIDAKKDSWQEKLLWIVSILVGGMVLVAFFMRG